VPNSGIYQRKSANNFRTIMYKWHLKMLMDCIYVYDLQNAHDIFLLEIIGRTIMVDLLEMALVD
jgi:hypothetical protein